MSLAKCVRNMKMMKSVLKRVKSLETNLESIQSTLLKHGFTEEKKYISRIEFEGEMQILDQTLSQKYKEHTDLFFNRFKETLDEKADTERLNQLMRKKTSKFEVK